MMKRISITIPENIYDYVKDIAVCSNRSISNQISSLLKESMEGDPTWHEEGEAIVRQ